MHQQIQVLMQDSMNGRTDKLKNGGSSNLAARTGSTATSENT